MLRVANLEFSAVVCGGEHFVHDELVKQAAGDFVRVVTLVAINGERGLVIDVRRLCIVRSCDGVNVHDWILRIGDVLCQHRV